MKALRVLLIPALVCALATLVAPGAPSLAGATAPAVPTLVGIRAAHHPGFDRLVLDFAGGLPSTHRVRYVDRIIADGSGLPVRLAGRARLEVVLKPANAHDANGPTTLKRRAFALPNIMATVRAGDFEAVTTYGIGLARRMPFHVFTLHHPDRVVIDVSTGFRTAPRSAYLFDEDAFMANQEPFFRPVTRPVPAARPLAGALDRVFAGPLLGERAHGLRLLRSHATGFADLRVTDGVARVRLTGGCSSDGSTVTVAGEIIPTLKQFASVDWVKIYGPAGHTENPTGHSDSIPACLEP